MWNVVTTEVTGEEPVTREEAKLFCSADGSDWDSLIDGLLKAAREKVESITGLLLRQQSIEITFTDGFPQRLPRAPLTLDTIAITYADTADSTAGFDDFEAFTTFDVVGLRPTLATMRWPVLYPGGFVTVAADGGFAPDDVPELLKLAIKLLVAQWFKDREGVGAVPDVVFNICNDFRLSRL